MIIMSEVRVSKYQKTAIHPCCRHGYEATILNQNTGKFIELNETALVVWESLEKGNTFDHLVKSINEKFDLDNNDTLESDLLNIIKDLESHKLINIVPN